MGIRRGRTLVTKQRPTTEKEPEPQFVTVRQAAASYGVTVDTMRKWTNINAIASVQPAGPGGRRFIPKTALPAVAL